MDSVDKDETAQENKYNTTEKIPLSIRLNQDFITNLQVFYISYLIFFLIII